MGEEDGVEEWEIIILIRGREKGDEMCGCAISLGFLESGLRAVMM